MKYCVSLTVMHCVLLTMKYCVLLSMKYCVLLTMKYCVRAVWSCRLCRVFQRTHCTSTQTGKLQSKYPSVYHWENMYLHSCLVKVLTLSSTYRWGNMHLHIYQCRFTNTFTGLSGALTVPTVWVFLSHILQTKSGKRKNVRTCDQCMSYSRGHGAVLPQHGAPLLDTGVEDITEPF